VLQCSACRASNLSFAGPLSGSDLMGVTGMAPDPAIRSSEGSAALADAARALPAAVVDAAVQATPVR
jgi:hypothetical protein